MAILTPPHALGAAGQVLSGRLLRLSLGAVFRPAGSGVQVVSGVLAGPANTQGELSLAGNLLTVQAFRAVIQSALDATAGSYEVINDAAYTFPALTAQHATQFRRSLVVARVDDSQVSGVASSSTTDRATLEVIDGPLAASLALTTLPTPAGSWLALGEVGIPPTGQPYTLTPYNPRTTIRGGILPLLTEAAILALPAASLWQGFRASAADTGADGVWDGTRWVFYDTRWQTYVPAIKIGNATLWTQGNSTVIGRYYRKGREVSVRVSILLGSTANFNSAASFVTVTAPPGCVPAATLATDGSSIPTVGTVEVINGGIAWGLVVIGETSAPAGRTFTFYPYTSANALSSATGSAGSWNLWASGQIVRFSAMYETNYDA